MRALSLTALGLLTLSVMACAAPPPPANQAALCRDAFQRFDREIERQGPVGFAGIGTRIETFPLDSTATTARLRQFDCILFNEDYPPPPPDLSLARAPALGTAGPRGYVHVATMAGDGLTTRLSQTLAELGWPVETRGAPGIGRRVFIGPVNGAAAQAAGVQAAQALGFAWAYPLSRVP